MHYLRPLRVGVCVGGGGGDFSKILSFYVKVLCNGLSGELSCTRNGLVKLLDGNGVACSPSRKNRRMDDLRFYFHFNSILVISGLQDGGNKKMCAMGYHLRLERFPLPAGPESGTPKSVGQRFTHLATRAPSQENDQL